jgi:hypothetical protein
MLFLSSNAVNIIWNQISSSRFLAANCYGTYFHKEVKPVFLEANADRGYIS